MKRTTKKASSQHHAERCAICRHRDRLTIETAFLDWTPQTQIARAHGVNRLQVFRHARAAGLFRKRDENVRAALAAFIERGLNLRPTPQSFVHAIIALSKLDNESRTVERVELTNGLGSSFAKMTVREMENYARDGTLPEWFAKEVKALDTR
jgi:hypothetical protein